MKRVAGKPSTFGKRVKRLRREIALNQVDVAKAIDVMPSTISNLENGFAQSASAETLYLLSRFFGISMDELYTGEQDGQTRHLKHEGDDLLSSCRRGDRPC